MKRPTLRRVNALTVLCLAFCACGTILGLDDFRVAETLEGQAGSGGGPTGSSGSDGLGTGRFRG